MDKKTYLDIFKKTYKEIPKDSKKKADELINRAVELALAMDECQEHIESEGYVVEMPQGNYSIMRENPYSKIYDQKIKAYLSVISALDKLMPDGKSEAISKAGEALAAFVANGKR